MKKNGPRASVENNRVELLPRHYDSIEQYAGSIAGGSFAPRTGWNAQGEGPIGQRSHPRAHLAAKGTGTGLQKALDLAGSAHVECPIARGLLVPVRVCRRLKQASLSAWARPLAIVRRTPVTTTADYLLWMAWGRFSGPNNCSEFP